MTQAKAFMLLWGGIIALFAINVVFALMAN